MSEATYQTSPRSDSFSFYLRPSSWSAAALLVLLTIAWLIGSGGEVWGETNLYWPLSAEVWSRQNSQHPIDPYTLTHMLHGVLCFWLIKLTLPQLPVRRQFFLAILFACGWEVVENSSFVIDRYRMVTASADYVGDAVVNSFVDILACGLGFFFARAVGFGISFAVFIAVEVLMIFLIRDNLLLNILMIIYPLDGVKAWQLGG